MDDALDKEHAENLSYENEVTSRRTVTIPLKEYDTLKEEQHYIKDKTLIDIIDNIPLLSRLVAKIIMPPFGEK